MTVEEVTEAVRDVGDSDLIEGGARLGYAANGLLHLLIAWLAVQVALVGSSAKADQSGALAALTGTVLGTITLWAAVVGFALLAVWQLTEAIVRRRRSVRLKSLAKAITYAAIGWSAWGFVLGGGSDSSDQSVDVTAALLERPLGRVLVFSLGLVVLGIGIYHVVKGWRKKFLHDLAEHPGAWVVYAGRWGYIAKGIALGFVALLFLIAGVKGTPDGATGLDGGLRMLLQLPGGVVPMLIVALGFAAYGVYSFARAKYARV